MATALTLPPDATGPTRRPWKRRRYNSIRDYAIALILRVDRIDEDGREIGFPYEHIRQMIVHKFPTVTYHGPHTGKPVKMIRKRRDRNYNENELHELHEIAYNMNQAGIRLPSRPRSSYKRKPHGA